jgi:ferredoxin
MKIRVDPTRCQGHGMCALNCPEMFELSDEDGHARVVQETVPSNLEISADMAKRSCPEGAIELY